MFPERQVRDDYFTICFSLFDMKSEFTKPFAHAGDKVPNNFVQRREAFEKTKKKSLFEMKSVLMKGFREQNQDLKVFLFSSNMSYGIIFMLVNDDHVVKMYYFLLIHKRPEQ